MNPIMIRAITSLLTLYNPNGKGGEGGDCFTTSPPRPINMTWHFSRARFHKLASMGAVRVCVTAQISRNQDEGEAQ